MHTMQRTSSSADISTYDGCGEASKKLQFIANFVFLTASLILIGTGKLVADIYIRLEIVTHTQSCIIKFCNDEIFYRITGAGLLGFYRLHMLEVITVDFMIVPMVRDLIVLIGLLFYIKV